MLQDNVAHLPHLVGLAGTVVSRLEVQDFWHSGSEALHRERCGESDALQAVALMQQGTVVELDAALALSAAKLGVDHKLPLADSIVYATAQRVHGTLWTQDEDFDGLAAVEYHPKTSAK